MTSILKNIKVYNKVILLIFLLTLMSTFFELFIPTLMANVVDIGIVQSNVPYILKMGIWMIVLSICAVLITIGSTYLSTKVALGFGRDLRRRLFVNVENFSVESFEKIGTASLITRTTNDIKQVQDVFFMILQMLTRAPLMLVGGVILAVTREPVLSLIFLISMPLLVFVFIIIIKKAVPLFLLLQQKTDRLNLVIRENLTGIRVIRAFNQTEHEKKRFNTANEEFRDIGIKVNSIIAFLFPLMLLVMNVTSIAIVWFGAIQIDNGSMQVGSLMAFLQYAMMILVALIMISIAFIMIPRAKASVDRINEVLSIIEDIKDPLTNENAVLSQKGLVEFRDVTYRYDGADKPVVEKISFQAKPGETTAIIGSTGAGKSTIFQLLLRFMDPDEGSILVDGIDIRNLAQKELRGKIGYVPQKVSIFSGTIAENIRFGNEDASDYEVKEALRIAQLMDFVKEQDDEIHTKLNQSGSNLSGGQKQRLSIARALVREPNIYLFDDSFSALDYQTDAKLRKAMKENTNDATLIIVGQRISTIEDAEQIIVLDEGKMVGIGTHKELLLHNSIYQEIVASQKSEEESA